jgi:acetyltransferase
MKGAAVRPHYLQRLFEPESVAVIGATDRLDAVGGRVLHNILEGGFRGRVYPVNRSRARVQGLPAVADVRDIEDRLDLLVIAVPAGDVADIITAAAGSGAVAAIVLSAGFGEQAAPGSTSGAGLAAAARAAGMALLGPHTLGVLRPSWHFNASFARGGVMPGRVALVSQSVGFCNAMLDWASSNGFGLSLMASPGAGADVDFGDILDFCAVDAETRSLLLYVERISDARAFISGLRLAARSKPVVVLRSGGYDAADAAFDAAVARAGAVRVRSVHELLTAARTLASGTRAATGASVAIVTNAAGPGAMASTRADLSSLPLAALCDETRRSLAPVMPEGWQCGNPLDLLGDADPQRYAAALRAVQADRSVHAVLVLLTPQGVTQARACAEEVVAASRGSRKPLVACWMGQDLVAEGRQCLAAASIPHFSSPERGVDALACLASYRRSQDMLLQLTPPLSRHVRPDFDRLRRLLAPSSAAPPGALDAEGVAAFIEAADLPFDPVGDGRTPAGRREEVGLSLRVQREALFGPVILAGPAGCDLQRLGGVQAALPPLNEFLCQDLLLRVQQRFAMSPPSAAGTAQLVQLLMALSGLLCELAEIEVLELSRLCLSENTSQLEGCLTVSASPPPRRIGPRAYAHMAIHPYPIQLEREVRLGDGGVVLLRPMRPEDAELERRFVDALSPESRYYRFMYRLDHLSTAMLARFTQIDYDREMALVAARDAGTVQERIIGVARYALNPDATSCEFALAVADEEQRHGIGRVLMLALFAAAAARGLTRMEGEVLAHNRKMLAFCRSLGFSLRHRLEEPDIVAVTRPLGPGDCCEEGPSAIGAAAYHPDRQSE